MTVVFDAGALVALERGNRKLLTVIKREQLADRSVLTHGGVIGQVWRGGRDRQANLARALRGIEVRVLDDALGREAGVLLGRAGLSDVIDAVVVLLSNDGDEIYTSDPEDIRELLTTAGKHVDLIPV